MATEFSAALAAAEREVAELRAKLEAQQRAVDEAKGRRAKAEAEADAARQKLIALDEEEKSLRAAFMDNPFWDQPTVRGTAAKVKSKP
jgi:hypothetical protein